jgi:hypothetical protein
VVVRRRRNKYGNIKTVVDGVTFHSRKEAARYVVLKEMQERGEIANLRLQVAFTLTSNGKKIGRYVADFVYLEDGNEIVEDVKGRPTALYRWKAKMMAAEHGVVIRET